MDLYKKQALSFRSSLNRRYEEELQEEQQEQSLNCIGCYNPEYERLNLNAAGKSNYFDEELGFKNFLAIQKLLQEQREKNKSYTLLEYLLKCPESPPERINMLAGRKSDPVKHPEMPKTDLFCDCDLEQLSIYTPKPIYHNPCQTSSDRFKFGRQINEVNVVKTSMFENAIECHDYWILVHGFPNNEYGEVLQMFGNTLTIVDHMIYENSMFLKLLSQNDLQRALQLNGYFVNRFTIGVAPMPIEKLKMLCVLDQKQQDGKPQVCYNLIRRQCCPPIFIHWINKLRKFERDAMKYLWNLWFKD